VPDDPALAYIAAYLDHLAAKADAARLVDLVQKAAVALSGWEQGAQQVQYQGFHPGNLPTGPQVDEAIRRCQNARQELGQLWRKVPQAQQLALRSPDEPPPTPT
jgi:hypothetical protein